MMDGRSVILHVGQGRIIDRTHETLHYGASGLSLVIAATVYWNFTILPMPSGFLAPSARHPIPRCSPLPFRSGGKYIAFSGNFPKDRAAEIVHCKPFNVTGDAYSA